MDAEILPSFVQAKPRNIRVNQVNSQENENVEPIKSKSFADTVSEHKVIIIIFAVIVIILIIVIMWFVLKPDTSKSINENSQGPKHNINPETLAKYQEMQKRNMQMQMNKQEIPKQEPIVQQNKVQINPSFDNVLKNTDDVELTKFINNSAGFQIYIFYF